MTDQHALSDGEGPAGPGPAGSSPPVPEDLLGLRIAAALIDLAVLAALLVMLSAATGGITISGASITFGLGGAWIGVFLLIVLLYYLVLESLAGQTLGKLLLDLRVLHAGGARPSAGAIMLRTSLRIVDWLPLLCLPGVQFEVTGGVAGQPTRSTLVFAFSGTTEYFVNCQYTPARAGEIRRGCSQVLDTFEAA